MTVEVRFIEAQTGFRVANLDRSLKFYSQFGFEQVYRNEDVHVVTKRDAVVLHFSTIEGKANTGCQIIVENVDLLHDQIQTSDIRIVYEIGDRDWGNRDFTVADPDDNEITFSEPLSSIVREDDRT